MTGRAITNASDPVHHDDEPVALLAPSGRRAYSRDTDHMPQLIGLSRYYLCRSVEKDQSPEFLDVLQDARHLSRIDNDDAVFAAFLADDPQSDNGSLQSEIVFQNYILLVESIRMIEYCRLHIGNSYILRPADDDIAYQLVNVMLTRDSQIACLPILLLRMARRKASEPLPLGWPSDTGRLAYSDCGMALTVRNSVADSVIIATVSAGTLTAIVMVLWPWLPRYA